MAWTSYDSPSEFFGALSAGYTLSSSIVGFETSTGSNKLLAEVTDAEAHKTEGDIRKVLFGLMEAIYTAYNAIPAGSLPTKMTMTKTSFNTGATGTSTYALSFQTDVTISATEVQSES